MAPRNYFQFFQNLLCSFHRILKWHSIDLKIQNGRIPAYMRLPWNRHSPWPVPRATQHPVLGAVGAAWNALRGPWPRATKRWQKGHRKRSWKRPGMVGKNGQNHPKWWISVDLRFVKQGGKRKSPISWPRKTMSNHKWWNVVVCCTYPSQEAGFVQFFNHQAKDLVEAPVETPKVETPKEEQEAELSQPQGEVGELQLEINEEKVEPIERLQSPQEDEIELANVGTDSEKSESESSCGSSESDEMDDMDVSFQESSGNPQPNRPNQPNLPYLVDNDSGVYFTLHQSPRRCWVHAFRWPSDHLWVRRFPGQLEKTALGQGFVAFASRRKVYVFSSGGAICRLLGVFFGVHDVCGGTLPVTIPLQPLHLWTYRRWIGLDSLDRDEWCKIVYSFNQSSNKSITWCWWGLEYQNNPSETHSIP